jgi:protein phosphatase methylesterase 1
LFVLHHGAGCSGLSFALCASKLKALAPDIGLVSPDARGHGETVLKDNITDSPELKNGSLDMSLSKLADDLEIVVDLLKEKMSWDEMPSLVLVGHSLGGAVVTEVAKRGKWGRKILGFAVLDVVEGSAVDALVSMNAYLASRPQTFSSLDTGIEWQ